jgi:hypothetical protein
MGTTGAAGSGLIYLVMMTILTSFIPGASAPGIFDGDGFDH